MTAEGAVIRNFWANVTLGFAILVGLVWLLGAPDRGKDVAAGARDRVADAMPSVERAVAVVNGALDLVMLVLLLAIVLVTYALLVRSGRLHAPWFASHVLAPVEARLRRVEDEAELAEGHQRPDAPAAGPPGRTDAEGGA